MSPCLQITTRSHFCLSVCISRHVSLCLRTYRPQYIDTGGYFHVLLGTFAVSTDHAAELGRHLDTWMTWTSNTLRLAWLGFHDDHSGVHSYHVSVGSTPFASDLNSVSYAVATTLTVLTISTMSMWDQLPSLNLI